MADIYERLGLSKPEEKEDIYTRLGITKDKGSKKAAGRKASDRPEHRNTSGTRRNIPPLAQRFIRQQQERDPLVEEAIAAAAPKKMQESAAEMNRNSATRFVQSGVQKSKEAKLSEIIMLYGGKRQKDGSVSFPTKAGEQRYQELLREAQLAGFNTRKADQKVQQAAEEYATAYTGYQSSAAYLQELGQNARIDETYDDYLSLLAQGEDPASLAIRRMEKELAYGMTYQDAELPVWSADEYMARVDAAIASKDYAAARNWVQMLLGSDLSSEERQRVAEYLDALPENDGFLVPDNWSAAEHIVEYYDRDPLKFLEMIQSEAGKGYMQAVQEEYGIAAPTNIKSIDDYAAYVEQITKAMESGGKSGFNAKQHLAIMDLQNPEDQIIQNATMAFSARSQEVINSAMAAGGMDSARMNSYIQAQKAYTTAAQIQNYLLTDENGWNEVDSGKLNGPTMTYLLGLMKEYGFPMGELTAENYTKVINTAVEHISRQAAKYRDALEASGYDMNDVQVYLESLQHGEMEKGNIAALQAAGVLDENGVPVQEVPWYDMAAYSAAGFGTYVTLDSVVGAINLINTGAAALSGKGNPMDTEHYQPMRYGTVHASPSGAWHELASKDLGETGKAIYHMATSTLQSLAQAYTFGSGALTTMGLSAAGDKAYQMIQSGATPGQAFAGGVLSGLIEAMTEKLPLEGILKGFKSKTVMGRLLLQLKHGATEGAEEMVSEGLNTLMDVMVLGDLSSTRQNIYKRMEEGADYREALGAELTEIVKAVGKAGFQGLLSGLFGAFISSGVTSYQIREASAELGENFADQVLRQKNTEAYALYAEAAGVENGDSDEIAAEKFSRWAESIYKQWMKADQEGEITLETAVRENDRADYEKALREDGKVNRFRARSTAELLAYEGRLSASEQATLDKRRKNKKVAAGLEALEKRREAARKAENAEEATAAENTEISKDATENAEKTDATEAALRKLAEEAAQEEAPLEQELAPRVKTVIENELEVSEDGKAHLDTGEAVTIQDMTKVEKGKERNTPYLSVVDAEGNSRVVPSDQIIYSSREEALLYEGFAQLGIPSAYFQEYWNGYQEMGNGVMSAGEYALYFEDAVHYGRANMQQALKRSPLDEVTKRTAFEAGRRMRSAELDTSKQRLQEAKNRAAQEKAAQAAKEGVAQNPKAAETGKSQKVGKVHYPEHMPHQLNKLQTVGVKLAERLASLGFDVHIYRSTLNEDGQWVNDRGEVAPNGYYRTDDGSIHVDLNAGADGRGTMVFTLAHEITHFLRQNDLQGFDTFAGLLVQWYEKKGVKVEDLIRAEMEEHDLSWDEAYEEVVARSCEAFLVDGNIVQRLTELRAKSKHLFEQIRKKVQEFVKWMRSIYKDVSPDSEEGRMLHEARGTVDHLYEAFAQAVNTALDNYSQVGVQKNTTDEGGVRYQLRPYTQTQIDNWASSKKIIVYKNDTQLLNFVNDAINGKNLVQKMYLGEVDDALAARIMTETGIDVNRRNVTIRSDNVRKICLYSHGNNSKEASRGQRAVVATDFLRISDVIGDPDKIEKGTYNDRNAIVFIKHYGNERMVVFAVDSGRSSLDLFVQTMYVNVKKGNITNVANAQTLALTSKTTVGTVPNKNIPQISSESNTSNADDSEKNSKRSSGSVQAALMDMDPAVVENETDRERLQKYQTDTKERLDEIRRQQELEAELRELEAMEQPDRQRMAELHEAIAESYKRVGKLEHRMIDAEVKLQPVLRAAGISTRTSKQDILTMSHEELQSRVVALEKQLVKSYQRQDTLTKQRDHAKAQSHVSQGVRVNPKGVYGFVNELLKEISVEDWSSSNVKGLTGELLEIFNKAAEIYDGTNTEPTAYLRYAGQKFMEKLLPKDTENAAEVTETAVKQIFEEFSRVVKNPRLKTTMDKVVERYQRVIQQQKALQEARLAKVKENAREREQEIISKYRTARSRSVEGRKMTVVRNRIKRRLKELNSLLNHGTKKKNVAIGMQDTAAALLKYGDVLFSEEGNVSPETMIRSGIQTEITDEESGLIQKYAELLKKRDDYQEKIENVRKGKAADAVSRIESLEKMVNTVDRELGKLNKKLDSVFVRERARMNRVTFSAVLQDLIDAYKALETSTDERIRGAYSSYVYDRLVAHKKTGIGVTIKDMSLTQLMELHDAVKMVVATVKKADTLIRNGKAESRTELAQQVQAELRKLYREKTDPRLMANKAARTLQEFSINNMEPYTAFEYIGSDTLTELFWDVVQGSNTYGRGVEDARVFIEETRAKYGYSKWDMEKAHVFKSADGLDFKLTLGEMFAHYAYSRRKDAYKHMTDGGYTFDATKTYKDENGTKRVRVISSETYRVTDEIINEIIEVLTDKQKAYVETMQGYLTKLGEKGNQVSRALYEIDLFKEEMYMPLMSDHDFRRLVETEQNKTQTVASLENMGMTKATVPGANNPIVLRPFDDVVYDHIDKMLKYHAYVIPLKNLRDVLDYVHAEEGGHPISIKNMIKSIHGEAAEKYLEQMLNDLNGGAVDGGARNPFMQFFSTAKGVTVAGNLSVIVQQPIAILRAMTEISPEYFVPVHLSEASKSHEKQWTELKNNVGIAVLKEMGGFDMGSNRSVQEYIGNSQTKWSGKKVYNTVKNATMWGASKADVIGWSLIWRAVKKEVADKQKLKPGSAELFHASAKRFTEVVTKTQVFDTPISRSGYMRSKRESVKFAVSYLGEPIKILNMAFLSHLKLFRAVRSKNYKNAKKASKKMARTSLVLLITAILNALAKSPVYAMRDDEEAESFMERLMKKFGMALREDMNPLGMLPFVRDLISIKDGWEIERPDVALLGALISAFNKAIKGKNPLEDWSEFVLSGSDFFGIPLKNVFRDGAGIVRLVGDITDELGPVDMGGALYRGLSNTERSKKEILYDAIVNGYSDKIEALKERYQTEDGSFDNGEYTSAVRTALKECDPRIHEAALARYEGDITGYTNILSEIEAEGHFVHKDIVAAITSEMKNIKNDREGSEPSEPNDPKTYNAGDYMASVLDEPETAEEVKAYMIQEKINAGKSKADAKSAFYSAVRDEIRDMYDMDELDRDTAYDYLIRFGGMDENDAYWQMEKWDYAMEAGTTEGYSKYTDFYTAVQTGKDLRKVVQLYLDKGSKKEDLAKQITDYFKPIYVAMTTRERAALKGYLLNAYVMLGKDRQKKLKDIDAWLKEKDD